MKPDKNILAWFDELIDLGQHVLETYTVTQNQAMRAADLDPAWARQWAASCLSLLRRVCGLDSDHYQQFNSFNPRIVFAFSAKQALGILKSAKYDYEAGRLFNIQTLIEANVFSDFLEQADYLLQSNYHGPAAVIAGAVIEDGLRKLCDKHSVQLPSNPTLAPRNDALAKVGAYSKLVHDKLMPVIRVRNHAAHGEWCVCQLKNRPG